MMTTREDELRRYPELRDPAEALLRCETFTAYIILRMQDHNLRCAFDPVMKGGRYTIETLRMDPFDHAAAERAKREGGVYKPKNGWERVLVIEAPDGSFTRPDSFVVTQLKQNRDITTAWLRGDRDEAEAFVYSYDG